MENTKHGMEGVSTQIKQQLSDWCWLSTISVTSYVPRIPGEPLNMQKTLGHLYLLEQIEARHLVIVFPTLKEFFGRIICMRTCRCMRVFISCTYLCKFYVCSCVHCLRISSVLRVNTKEWLYTGRVDLLVVQISSQ